MQKQIELLAPAGGPQSLHAALSAGADAVYLGLNSFNARQRATNFALAQLPAVIELAHKHKAKVYVTFNTLIKNNEIDQAIELLFALQELKIDALIIQDWGIRWLVKRFFSRIPLHASTQMGHHNSTSAIFASKAGFSRVILARELTMPEITAIARLPRPETEVFVHGALCYSFSGYCLFSSLLGGQSANRGGCRQPCRRRYNDQFAFSMKDLQLLKQLLALSAAGVKCVKIEGRMKPAEYVHKVVSAYRLAIDGGKTETAEQMLADDLGRNKTTWFAGAQVANAIGNTPFTGTVIGAVQKVHPQGIEFTTNKDLHLKDRLRVMPASGRDANQYKITGFKVQGKPQKQLSADQRGIAAIGEHTAQVGDPVLWAGSGELNFSNKLAVTKQHLPHISASLKHKIAALFDRRTLKGQPRLWVRVDSLDWLRKVRLEPLTGLLMRLSSKDMEEFAPDASFLKDNLDKIWIELPLFIAENRLEFYRQQILRLQSWGIKNFAIAHLWQTMLLPVGCNILTTENVYIFNDAAVRQLREHNITNYIYPQENDIENLYRMNDKTGIIPLHFYPRLFFSRQPVKVEGLIKDRDTEFNVNVSDGFTVVTPQDPVCVTQMRPKLEAKGFSAFLLDFSSVKASENRYNTVLKRYQQCTALPKSSSFNYRRGLK